MKSSGEGYTPFRVASFSREGALSASDDKRGVGKAGRHRSGDGGPYTWAGGEELKVRPNVTRRLALTLQRATKHVLLTQMSVQPTESKTYSVPRDSTKELCPSMRAIRETASKPLKLASSGVQA